MTNIPQTFAAAVAHHQAGRLSAAEALYRQVLAADPDNVPTLNNLAVIVPQDEAVSLLNRAVTIKPDHVDALLNLGNALQSVGKLDDAIAWYERAVALKPDYVAAPHNIANVRKSQGRLNDAITWYRRALAIAPDYVEAHIQLADALQAAGKLDDAAASYQRALALSPDNPDVHFGLGSIFQTQGNTDAAIVRYETAIALRPNFAAALHNLGTIHALALRHGPATKWYRWALALDPSLQGANINMVSILEGEGRLTEAKVYRDRVSRPIPHAIETAPEPRRTVLIPSAMGPGNVPLDLLLPKQTTTRIRWYVDYATDDQERNLPPADVVFNGIGNADLTAPSFDRLVQFHDRRPMLNPPAAVARTRRDLLPQQLAGIPDVVVPPVVRLRRDEVYNIDLTARLAAGGLTGPLLLRPIAGHGGTGMVLVESPQQLTTASFGDADAFFLIDYRDFRSADGHYRKYRTIFVDRIPYPYHLAISDHWLVHYFSANMLSAPWKREEEHRFLADPAAALGPKASAALAAIGRRLDMDYAGIDFSLLPDGRLLVFEANANMSVQLYDPIEQFPHKHVYVPLIVKAFEAMLERHEKKR